MVLANLGLDIKGQGVERGTRWSPPHHRLTKYHQSRRLTAPHPSLSKLPNPFKGGSPDNLRGCGKTPTLMAKGGGGDDDDRRQHQFELNRD